MSPGVAEGFAAPRQPWFPAPLEFPASVADVRRYLDARVLELLDAPPSLDPGALAASGGAPQALDAVRRGQERIAAGACSAALGAVEPYIAEHLQAAALAGLLRYALGRVQAAVMAWETLDRRLAGKEHVSAYHSFANLKTALILQDKSLHPEADAMALLCHGRGIDVGCGGNKTCPGAIGVDLTRGGDRGAHGGQANVVSQADVVASGDYLPMFEDASLDFVIARHNLEHYQDPVKTLREWTRVLKPGGLLGVAAPDHEYVDTIRLDATHYHVFTLDSMRRLLERLAPLRPLTVERLIPGWSLMAVAQKQDGAPWDYHTASAAREAARAREKAAWYAARGNAALADQCRREAERLEAGA